MNTRERRERKAERLRGWADNAGKRATQRFNAADPSESNTGIPFGQPILVGHHSERRHRNTLDRIDNNMRKGVEESDKRDRLNSRADGIEDQIENTIFSDDHDAIEKLEAKIAGLEAKRDMMKAFNKSALKHSPDYELLNDALKADLLSVATYASYQLGKGGGFPSYALSNLGATIRTAKKRLAGLQLIASGARLQSWRTITAKFDGDCPQCGDVMAEGTQISKVAPRRWVHEACAA